MTKFKHLKVENRSDGLRIVTLNRAEVLNAINTQMGQEIVELFRPLRFSPGNVRCVVITGAEDKAFCAGGDLKERRGMTSEEWRRQHAIFEEGSYAIMDSAIPVIAAVNGVAYGGGCELALACDFIYASKDARFALTETSLGIMPGAGGTQMLPRAVGIRRAKELILSARPFTAEEAYNWGMVNGICEHAALIETAIGVGMRIAANAPIAVRQAKMAMHNGVEMDLHAGLVLEVQAYQRMIDTHDRREGINAFNEKRRPNFLGE